MALFKINRGANTQRLINPNYSENGENKYIQPKDGYCYFDTSTGLFFIDAENENGEVIRAPINADTANKLSTSAGSATQPIYFSNGKPVAIAGTIANSTSGNAATASKLATARTISLTGSVTGSGSFDGSGNLSITTTTNHTHKYAGSSSAGGSATSAVKLDTTTAGSATQPVYFSEGKPVACTYSLNKTVPSDAKFTDTVYTHPSYTNRASGLYKITVDNTGHVAGAIAVTGHDIENILGYTPSDNEHTHLYAGSESIGGPANSVKESLSFAVGGVEKGSYNGSEGHRIEINAIDLNISSALRYIGRTNNEPVDTVITLVSGEQVIAEPGNVVIWTQGNIEYLFDDDYTWVQLGEASSFALAPHIHGNISNQGYITDEGGNSLANRILISDGTGYIEGGIEFSNTLTQKFLNENGTWQSVQVTNNAPTLSWGATSTIGSVAGVNLQVTMPENPNTDEKVEQTAVDAAGYTNWRPLIWGSSNSGTEGFTPSTTTSGVYTTQTLSCQPSSGTIRANIFKGSLSGNASAASKLAIARTINGMQFDGTININNYGVCDTAAATAAKTVTVGSTFSLTVGAQVTVKFTYTNSVASPTLNVNGTGAKPIYRYGTTTAGTSSTSSSWASGAVQRFTYDGVGWIMDYWYNSTYYTTAVTCNTAGGTAAKVGSTSYYTLANNKHFYVMFVNDNTAASALTLNINSNGAKPIYINGSASSASNYTLPSGLYHCYYDGTKYSIETNSNFRTGGIVSTGDVVAKANITLTGVINKNVYSGGAWVDGRKHAALRTSTSVATSSFSPVVSAKTQLGSWDLGPCHPDENFYFSYAKDTNFNAGTNSTMRAVYIRNNGIIMGAAWNDYAEYRITKEEIEPGRCVTENGDDILSLSTARLQRGCEVVSDTFGFAIGETEESKTPIAVSGRVLAYGYESREEFKKHIGWPVCSGPNGTVSIMTEEEEEKYPSRIIGTISTVPDYEEWGSGNVKVNGRIWIRIK